MGMYSTNNYNLTIPVAAITPIMEEYNAKDWHGDPLPRTADALVTLIGDEFGADDVIDFLFEGSDVTIHAFSYGKVGDSESLAAILAAHGATGIVWGELEGDFFLLEFVDGEVKGHAGQVVFPSYTGPLYS